MSEKLNTSRLLPNYIKNVTIMYPIYNKSYNLHHPQKSHSLFHTNYNTLVCISINAYEHQHDKLYSKKYTTPIIYPTYIYITPHSLFYITPIMHTCIIYYIPPISNHSHTHPYANTSLFSKIDQAYIYQNVTPPF